jgi:acyl dehydratase
MNAKTSTLRVGDTLPVLKKTAHAEIDPNARNVIHTDDFAKDFGMRGALVPGSVLLSYVLEMLYNFFGPDWLNHGKIQVSFLGGGAVNGDQLTARGVVTSLEETGEGLRIHLEVDMDNQDHKKILAGTASCLLPF